MDARDLTRRWARRILFLMMFVFYNDLFLGTTLQGAFGKKQFWIVYFPNITLYILCCFMQFTYSEVIPESRILDLVSINMLHYYYM